MASLVRSPGLYRRRRVGTAQRDEHSDRVPFQMFRKTLPGSIGTELQDRLQRLADQGIRGIRSAGSAYTAPARKPNAGDSPCNRSDLLMYPPVRGSVHGTRVWNEAQIREGAECR